MTTLPLASGRDVPEVKTPHPHEPWPPKATDRELGRLAEQRNLDLAIRGNDGPIVELEQLFRQRFTPSMRHSIAFNSGTSALLAAYMALQVGEGDEVIAPVLTYHAAVSPATALGAVVRFADIDLQTRGMDPDHLEELIGPRTKAIVIVHHWGHAADMTRIMNIADRHGVAVIEDCSHAHGSAFEGTPVGSFGKVAVFSLQANKAVFAGEGGVLATDDQEVADRAILAGHYRDRALRDVAAADLHAYWESGFGFKLRMSPFNAIVGIESLRAFDELAGGRQAALSYMNDRLAETGLLDPLDVPNAEWMGAWYGFKPLPSHSVRTRVERSTLVRMLQDEGVEVDAPSGRMLVRLPLFAGRTPWRRPGDNSTRRPTEDEIASTFPVAHLVESNALSLPTFYRWPHDRFVIDEYLRAFSKVALAIESGRIPNDEPRADRASLPRDGQSHGR
ncbi:aminotransferase class V-fold PLP-dependent enzyme [Microbacterium sp. H83]|uniref:aminotransferase class V-fold PLP-dependent enzyme n=1 Tax=Microbacterium sp. H83 TaxID=1827324 RepID=UPI000834AE7B|nr:aminotransferase class V-fold PLP-dependent enzyme [Microbacterium sp. H83]